MSILIKNGTVITAADRYLADILVEGEQIIAVGLGLKAVAAEEVDATGMYVFPGAVDVHTHFDLSVAGTVTADDFRTGTIAAAAGGTTCIIDFAIQPRGGTLRQGRDIWHEKADGKCAIDYSFHLILNDLTETVLSEIPEMILQGYPSIKLFMPYKGILQVDDATIFRVLQLVGKLGGLVMVHAENGDIIEVLVKDALAAGQVDPIYHALTRPSVTEEEAVNRFITMVRLSAASGYVVHLSSAGALEKVEAARKEGVSIFAETCPQYLFLDLDRYREPDFGGAKYVMSPPLREKGNEVHLWRGLANGSLQAVATDHCSFNWHGQKELGRDNFTKIPNGMPGVENRVQLLYAGGVVPGKISIHKFIDLVSTAPAKLFGLFPRKGTIAPGSDADLVIFNPEAPFTITGSKQHQNVDYNPYEGFSGKGVPEKVYCRGKLIMDGNRFVGEIGYGRFQPRNRFSCL